MPFSISVAIRVDLCKSPGFILADKIFRFVLNHNIGIFKDAPLSIGISEGSMRSEVTIKI